MFIQSDKIVNSKFKNYKNMTNITNITNLIQCFY